MFEKHETMGRLQTANGVRSVAIAAAASLLAVACATEDVDGEGMPLGALEAGLAVYGVADVVSDGAMHQLYDAAGVRVGYVDLSEAQRVEAELHGQRAGLSAEDSGLSLHCNADTHLLSSGQDTPWELADPAGARPAPGCLDALAVAQLLSAQTPSFTDTASNGCSSFSGWVWGSSCDACFSSIPGSGFSHTSCTIGWLTTSCTRSSCPISSVDSGVQIEEPLAN